MKKEKNEDLKVEYWTVEYWTDAWKNSSLTNSLEHSKKVIKKNVFDLRPYHMPYKRQIYIKMGGCRCLLNKYNKL